MQIAALLKYVLDPEILSREFALDPVTGAPSTTFPSFKFDQYDRIALEIALKARDSANDAQVTTVCIGPDAAQDRLRETLALKANDAVLIETTQHLTDHERAAVFADWAKGQEFSIILCGRMSSDTDSAEVGPLLAEWLDWPLVANVVAIERRDQGIACKREVNEGYEWIFMSSAFVATATNAPDNNPRKPRLQDVMRAQKLRIGRMAASDHLGADYGRGVRTIRAHIPSAVRVCHRIEGAAPAEKAVALSRRLLPLLKQRPEQIESGKAPS